MTIKVIAAISLDRIIGTYHKNKGKLPWAGQSIAKGDLRRFKELTNGDTIVLGRKTFEELTDFGRKPVLPDRQTIVVSQSLCSMGAKSFKDYPDVLIAPSVTEAYVLADTETVWVAGGRGVYKEAINSSEVSVIDLTVIPIQVFGEVYRDSYVYFPPINESRWKREVSVHPYNDKLRILHYQRR